MGEQSAPTRADVVIARIASRQHGVVSWRQLIDAGLGRGAIEHRVRAGRLHRLYRGIFAVGHLALTRDGRWMAAALACGAGAALCETSGLALWDLRPSSSAATDIVVATRNGRRRRDRIRLHRSGTLSADELTTHRAIPVTTVPRTLLDCAARLPAHSLARAVERADVLELFDLTAVRATLARHAGHRGAARLIGVLDLYRDEERTRSDLEAMFRSLCDAHGLPRPLVNHIVDGEEVDFLWPDRRVAVETDGRATHLTRAAFERDRVKDAKLTAAGWRVVRFTHRRITREPRAVASTLRELLQEPRRPTTRTAR